MPIIILFKKELLFYTIIYIPHKISVLITILFKKELVFFTTNDR